MDVQEIRSQANVLSFFPSFMSVKECMSDDDEEEEKAVSNFTAAGTMNATSVLYCTLEFSY